MFSVFVPSDFSLKKAVAVDLASLPETAVWIDLVKPTVTLATLKPTDDLGTLLARAGSSIAIDPRVAGAERQA